MTSELVWESAALTDVGAVRDHNEDSLLQRSDDGLWVVADGMGGHSRGDEASQAAVASLQTLALSGTLKQREQQVIKALHEVHAALQDKAKRDGAGIIGTTVAAVVFFESMASCIWVGDSRIYLSRLGELRQLTTDHTQVNELVRLGLLAPEDAEVHPAGHVLTRALGGDDPLQPDIVRLPIQVDDVFLLCSDGLTGKLSEAELASELIRWPPQVACKNLMSMALGRKAEDNVSLIVIGVDDGVQSEMTMINPAFRLD